MLKHFTQTGSSVGGAMGGVPLSAKEFAQQGAEVLVVVNY
jgi:hypothetical protein